MYQPAKKYSIILADPPWKFRVWCFGTGKGRLPDDHYPTMTIEELCSLPIKDIASKDCILFLWTTFPKIADQEVFKVIEAWGFTCKSAAFVWVKQNKNSSDWMGLVYWTRGNPEVCLLATKGHPHRLSKSVRQLIFSQRREHSRKPDEVRERIVQLMGDLPRIELFARQKVEGWDSVGFDIDGLDIRQSLEQVRSNNVSDNKL